MAVIAGARTFHQIRATVKAGFLPVMKVSWVTSPIALAFAQKFLPEHTWVPFFNIVGFFIGTYVNTHTKKKRLEALRKVFPLPVDLSELLLIFSSATTTAVGPAANTRSATTKPIFLDRNHRNQHSTPSVSHIQHLVRI